jgi:hypothetical protein
MTDTSAQTQTFTSTLPTGSARFLAEVLDHALSHGRRTPKDFIRHFPASAIMESLDGVPQVRAIFLTVLVGVRDKTAMRTSASDAGRLLQAALEEDDCDAESIVDVFNPDDRIRYLDARKVWLFLTEGDFWKVSRSKDSAAHKVAQAHIAYMLDRALAHDLVSHADVFEGITLDVLAEKLPRSELAKILKKALTLGRETQPFVDRDLHSAVPSAVLADHIALPQIMDGVVVPMARAAGFVDKPADGKVVEVSGENFPSWSAGADTPLRQSATPNGDGSAVPPAEIPIPREGLS